MFKKLTELFKYHSVTPGQFVDHNGNFTEEAMTIMRESDESNYLKNIEPILNEMRYKREKEIISTEQFSQLNTIRVRAITDDLAKENKQNIHIRTPRNNLSS